MLLVPSWFAVKSSFPFCWYYRKVPIVTAKSLSWVKENVGLIAAYGCFGLAFIGLFLPLHIDLSTPLLLVMGVILVGYGIKEMYQEGLSRLWKEIRVTLWPFFGDPCKPTSSNVEPVVQPEPLVIAHGFRRERVIQVPVWGYSTTLRERYVRYAPKVLPPVYTVKLEDSYGNTWHKECTAEAQAACQPGTTFPSGFFVRRIRRIDN